MIYINIGRNEERFSLKCSGHAEYAPAGQDIVCAAVTVLCYTLIENLPPGKWNGRMDEGDIYINCECSEQSDERKAFEVIAKGIRMLESAYPANIALWEGHIFTEEEALTIARRLV